MIPSAPTKRDPRLVLIADIAPALVYTGAVFYSGLIPLGALPAVGFIPTDKILHAVVFGGLALLIARAARALLPRWPIGKRLSLGVLGASVLGAALEVCQSFVPYRSAEFLDWLADTVGAAGSVALLALFLQLVPRRAHG